MVTTIVLIDPAGAVIVNESMFKEGPVRASTKVSASETSHLEAFEGFKGGRICKEDRYWPSETGLEIFDSAK